MFTIRINGRFYGEYSTREEAERIAKGLHVNAGDEVTVE